MIYANNIDYSSKSKILTITFNTEETFTLSAEYLRVYSPSSEVRGHLNTPPKLITGRIYVNIFNIERIGNYAIRINFDDLHNTGIYSWNTLYDLGKNQQYYWNIYLQRLEQENQSRMP